MGSVLNVDVFVRPLEGEGDGVGRVSTLGATGATVTSGEVTAPPAVPGAASTSTCPTRITLTFSMLFHAASSR